jgi:tRNA (cytidine/uridine-2'-O-)-methyltransferase
MAHSFKRAPDKPKMIQMPTGFATIICKTISADNDIKFHNKEKTLRVALYQPDIAGNTGTIIRMCACFGAGTDIIEPCGFPLGDRQLKRALMDYDDHADILRHRDWDTFKDLHAQDSLYNFRFRANDILLMGSESAGVPGHVAQQVSAGITIPMQAGPRSLNVAVAAAIALGEGLRQTGI